MLHLLAIPGAFGYSKQIARLAQLASFRFANLAWSNGLVLFLTSLAP